MDDVKKAFKKPGFFICVTIVLFVSWLIPWVWTLHTGMLFYFPYHSDGSSRYMRFISVWDKEWTSSENLPETCKAALVASEDTLFTKHHGVDWSSTHDSYKESLKRKKIRRGGSTLTQQIVKNAFLSRDRSYIRKGREIIGALLLDAIMSKDTQLTWYFNLVEFGPEIYGVQNAAQHYFKKNSSELTPFECISLVLIVPSPKKWNASISKKKYTNFFTKRYQVIVDRMRILNDVPPKTLAQARTQAPFAVRDRKVETLPTLMTVDQLLDALPDFEEDFKNKSPEAVTSPEENTVPTDPDSANLSNDLEPVEPTSSPSPEL